MIYLPKSQPAPACLEVEKAKANGSYNCGDVLAILKTDFKNKCYICEDKEPHVINTEHFIPHKGNKDLKFDWNNLFYCCGHCNNTKLANSLYDDILNCTIEGDGVDTKIKYSINPFPKEKAVFKAIDNTAKVNNTIELLKAVYNGTTELKKIESDNLRKKLLHEIKYFQGLLFDYFDDSNNDEEKATIRNKIDRQLRATSSFTAFKKWIIRDNEMLNAEFQEYLT